MVKKSKFIDLNMIKTARNDYIKGYNDNDKKQFFPTLDIIANEYSIGLSKLKQIAANNQPPMVKKTQRLQGITFGC